MKAHSRHPLAAAVSAALLATAPSLFATDIEDKLTTTAISPGVVFGGTALGTANPDLGGIGNRMFWYPGKAAFRVGGVSGTYTAGQAPWDDANIGRYSFAAGLNSKATTENAIALGKGAAATGSPSGNNPPNIAIGNNAAAAAQYGSSLAIGNNSIATGWGSTTAIGPSSFADVGGSTAVGSGARATTPNSSAFGYSATASGNNAVAVGYFSTASGSDATTVGSYNVASGQRSTASGYNTTARGYATTVVGHFNAIDAPSASTWVATDPLFIIGNGTGVSTHAPAVKNSNAFTVLKDGTVIIPKRQGDISMGEFGN